VVRRVLQGKEMKKSTLKYLDHRDPARIMTNPMSATEEEPGRQLAVTMASETQPVVPPAERHPSLVSLNTLSHRVAMIPSLQTVWKRENEKRQ
jgi:hypothetical protein